jgi:hypothetical protein
MTGYKGTFVISWSQTEVDGLAGGPVGAIEVGASWRWRGSPVRIDGPNDVLVLTGHEGESELRARASRAVRRIVGNTRAGRGLLPDYDEPLFDRYFVVSDGRRSFPITLIDLPEVARPLLLFLGELPPEETDLWIAKCVAEREPADAAQAPPKEVICFAGGTLLATPEGPRPVEALTEGDRLLTRDDGPQPILWIGHRHVTGARLHAMPEMRPIRVRAGALGRAVPVPDLIVSPQHRLLLKGRMAQDLFNTPEVLVSARDMLNDRTILRDYALRGLSYYHLLMQRHQVVWANGLETESFHPAQTSLDTIDAAQRWRLLQVVPGADENPHGYGPAARRLLSRSEAAILLHEARNRH